MGLGKVRAGRWGSGAGHPLMELALRLRPVVLESEADWWILKSDTADFHLGWVISRRNQIWWFSPGNKFVSQNLEINLAERFQGSWRGLGAENPADT